MQAPAPRILLVDDDDELRAMLRRYLAEHGFEVRALANAERLDQQLQRESFDVLVLDLMLPGEDGLSVCRRLRVDGNTLPILMLTARGDATDRIVGLEMGADDYLAKPFDPRELLARLHSILRRQEMLHGGARWTAPGVVRFGRHVFNLTRLELQRDGELVNLSSTELQLLRVLATNPGRPMSRENLLERIRGRDYDAMDRTLDVQVMRLRRKIEDDASMPRHIRTVWGVGYVFIADVPA